MRRNPRRRYRKKAPERSIGIFEIVNGLLTILLIVLGGLVSWTMFKYNFLNFKGINYAIFGIIIFSIISAAILVLKKKAKIFNVIMLIIMNIALIFSYVQLKTAVNLFDDINDKAAYREYTMSVVVLKDDEATTLDDLKGEMLSAPVSADGENINKLMKEIRDKGYQGIELSESKNYMSSYEQLISGTTRAMVLNSSFQDLIRGKYTDFYETTKKVFEFKIIKKIDLKASANIGDTFNVYISGIDTFGEVSTVSRSDVNIIMTVNKKTGKILLTTTPRDAYLPIADDGDNEYDKLTHAGLYGVESSIHTLENLYGIKLDYYARLNFTSFLKLIDLVGGVDVYNDQSFVSEYGSYNFEPGIVHLDADKALGFVRERYNLLEGDNDRGKNQEKVIAAIVKKLTSKETLKNYKDIVKELSESIQTNMPIETAMGLANEQFKSNRDYNISSQALTGEGVLGLPSYAMPGASLYMLQVDEQSLMEVKASIKEVMDGK